MATASVLEFPIPQQAPSAVSAVTQAESVISTRNLISELQSQLDAAENSIQTRIEAGSEIEPGTHTAWIKSKPRRSVAWREVAERLGDRLYGNGKGQSYCERVLGSTKATETFSLVVS